MRSKNTIFLHTSKSLYLFGLILFSAAAFLLAASLAHSPRAGEITSSLCLNSKSLFEAKVQQLGEMLQTNISFGKSLSYRSKRSGSNTLNSVSSIKHKFNSSTQLHQDVSCSADLCSTTPAFSASHGFLPTSQFNRPSVSTQAAPSSAATTTKADKKWWKQGADIWIEANSEKEFFEEIQSGDKPVFVDFYATWCHGCEKSFPEICKMIKGDPELRSKFKFLKVCVDGLRGLVKSQGIHSLPYVIIFEPGRGRLVALNMPVSRVKNLKHNLQVLLLNPGMDYTVDPNGFILPSEPHMNIISNSSPQAQTSGRGSAAGSSRTWLTPAGQHPIPSPGAQPLHLQQGTSPGTDISSIVGNLSHSRMAQQQQFGLAASHASVLATSPSNLGTSGSASSFGSGSGTGSSVVSAPSPAPASSGPIRLVRLPVKGVNDERYMSEKLAFLKLNHNDYGYSGKIDELYPKEVGCRLQLHEHYVDYTGASVYCQSQLDAVFQELRQHMFGNPHSENPSSSLTSELVEDVRDRLMRFFNADPREYQLVFTRSATGALHMVGETFPWSKKSVYRYLRENHNSVLGIREYTLQGGGAYEAVDELFVDQWLASEPGGLFDNVNGTGTIAPGGVAAMTSGDTCIHVIDGTATVESPKPTGEAAARASALLPPASAGEEDEMTYSLFAFPGEENFAGVKYPIRWARQVQARSTPKHRWLTLIDAAAYVPSQPLDMAQVQADFVAMSFYKMFGYPTGLGALIVKTNAVPLMKKVFWGGGTVSLATSQHNFHVFKCRPSDKLEDGTLGFLDIISLKHGLKVIENLGGMKRVQSHVHSITAWAFRRMASMRHSNGSPIFAIFGKHGVANNKEVQGGIINFEVLRPDGSVFSYKKVEREAATRGFHLRTGTGCNPGAGYTYLGVEEDEVQSLAGSKEGCHDDVEFVAVQRPTSTLFNSQLLRSIANVAQGTVTPAKPTLVHVSLGGGKRCDGSTPLPAEAASETTAGSTADAPPVSAPSSPQKQQEAFSSQYYKDLPPPSAVAGADAGSSPAPAPLKTVQVPLGSIRVSFGYMSTFEDVYALTEWLEKAYTDRY